LNGQNRNSSRADERGLQKENRNVNCWPSEFCVSPDPLARACGSVRAEEVMAEIRYQRRNLDEWT
jgi:hypothetical protein